MTDTDGMIIGSAVTALAIIIVLLALVAWKEYAPAFIADWRAMTERRQADRNLYRRWRTLTEAQKVEHIAWALTHILRPFWLDRLDDEQWGAICQALSGYEHERARRTFRAINGAHSPQEAADD